MGKKIKNTKTPEQRRAEAEALQGSIAEQVEELRNTDQWKKMLDYAQKFHAYSINNLLLIMAQMETATQVAGYRKWQSLGRQVRKGERGIRIFGSGEKKITEEDENGEEVTRRRRIFFPVSVFDISQTDKMEGTEDVPEVVHRLTGDDPKGILFAVVEWLTGKGWTVDREAIPGEINGLTQHDYKRVVIDSHLTAAQAAKTALHEAAHVVLHAEESPSEYIAHRGVKETEAESVAYVVSGILGMDTSSYSIGYVAGWSGGDAELIKDTAQRVLKAAHIIADGIVEDPAPAEQNSTDLAA